MSSTGRRTARAARSASRSSSPSARRAREVRVHRRGEGQRADLAMVSGARRVAGRLLRVEQRARIEACSRGPTPRCARANRRRRCASISTRELRDRRGHDLRRNIERLHRAAAVPADPHPDLLPRAGEGDRIRRLPSAPRAPARINGGGLCPPESPPANQDPAPALVALWVGVRGGGLPSPASE
jgi:hypothetical protein